jgi:hypothetical protein
LATVCASRQKMALEVGLGLSRRSALRKRNRGSRRIEPCKGSLSCLEHEPLRRLPSKMATTNVPDTIDQLSNQIQGLYQERVVALEATYASMTEWLREVEQEVPEKYKRYHFPTSTGRPKGNSNPKRFSPAMRCHSFRSGPTSGRSWAERPRPAPPCVEISSSSNMRLCDRPRAWWRECLCPISRI